MSYQAQVLFRHKEDGGKLSGPPTGARYAATAVAVLGDDRAVLPGWPQTAPQFSVVLEFDTSPAGGEWSTVTVSALVEGAPGTDALKPGAELFIMEGPRDVAQLIVDAEPPPS